MVVHDWLYVLGDVLIVLIMSFQIDLRENLRWENHGFDHEISGFLYVSQKPIQS